MFSVFVQDPARIALQENNLAICSGTMMSQRICIPFMYGQVVEAEGFTRLPFSGAKRQWGVGEGGGIEQIAFFGVVSFASVCVP